MATQAAVRCGGVDEGHETVLTGPTPAQFDRCDVVQSRRVWCDGRWLRRDVGRMTVMVRVVTAYLTCSKGPAIGKQGCGGHTGQEQGMCQDAAHLALLMSGPLCTRRSALRSSVDHRQDPRHGLITCIFDLTALCACGGTLWGVEIVVVAVALSFDGRWWTVEALADFMAGWMTWLHAGFVLCGLLRCFPSAVPHVTVRVRLGACREGSVPTAGGPTTAQGPQHMQRVAGPCVCWTCDTPPPPPPHACSVPWLCSRVVSFAPGTQIALARPSSKSL